MAGEWQEVQLGDVTKLMTGYPFKSQHYTDDADAPRLIGGDNIAQGYLRWDNVRRWPRDMTNGLDEYWLETGDVVLAMDRTWIEAGLKRAAVGSQDVPSLLIQRTSCLRGTNELNTAYLRYVIGSQAFTQYVMSVQTGTAVPHISPAQIRAFSFLLPSPAEQCAIAHILGTLDDKIELNRRRNQTLEAMARALFKDWFVDFGPVRAKMEGREPYLPRDIWALFPERLDDVGKPEGWGHKCVSDFMKLAYGKSLPAGKRNHGSVPVYGSGGITGSHDEALIKGPAIIVGRKGTVGSLYWDDRPCFPIDTVFYVQPEAPLSFCYYLLGSLPLRNMNTDAAVPGLNRENVYRLDVTDPPSTLISAFAETASHLRDATAAVSSESETLSQLRDTLLPKLISGELRIADADVAKFSERTGI